MAISINKATIVGRVGADPKTAGRDNQIVRFSVATSESWRNKTTGEREERTQWHTIVVFNEHKAKFARDYLKKGDLVYVEGQIETRRYEKDDTELFITEIVVRPFSGDIQIQSKDRSGGGREESHDGASRAASGRGSEDSRPAYGFDDDIPF